MLTSNKSNISGTRTNLLRNFDSISPTTVAVNYELNSSINICKLYPLLRSYGANAMPGQIKNASFGPFGGSKNTNTKTANIGGTKSKAHYVSEDKNETYMKNTIMIDIMTDDRELNIKLFKDKMHSCGFKRETDGKKGAQYLVNVINNIISELDYLQENLVEYQKLVEWLKPRCLLNGFERSHLVMPKDIPETESMKRMYNFVTPHIMYYQSYDENYNLYLNHLSWLPVCKIIMDGPKFVEIVKSNTTMMNFNHELSFSLQKIKLALVFKENPDFRVAFDNMKDHSVTITLPYDYDSDKKSREHTFSVHHEGHINQSSPNREMAKAAYEKFITYLMENKKEIMIAEKEQIIYYKPYRPLITT